MIRVTVLYPNKPGGKFDFDYYLNKHMKLVHDKFGPMGLVKTEVEKGLAGGAPGAPPQPYVALGHMMFNSLGDFLKANEAHGKDLGADVPNFTNIEPQFQISEIVA
jgi:uncharacterized protein (TIGR02118 family)